MSDLEAAGGRTRRSVLSLIGAAAAGTELIAEARAAAREAGTSKALRSGASGPLRSAGVMTFAPDGTLFVGDIAGAAVHAFAFRPADFTSQTNVVLGNFSNFEGRDLIQGLDHKLAGLLGTTPDKVVINDMVVHSPSQQIFLSVERGRSVGALPAIVKMDGGSLAIVDLSQVPHTTVSIPNMPDPTAMLEFEPQRTFAITDVKYHNGEVFVSGVSNQRFASTLYRIPYPFNSIVRTSTVEIWHPVHGEWETRAPIIRQVIRELGGQTYLFAVYGCTPLVRFPLNSLTDGAHVRGEVIGQLGYGSNPLDMVTFQDPFDAKEYLMVTIDVRSAARIAVVDLATAPAEPTDVPIDFGPSGLGRTQGLLPVIADHFAILNGKWAVEIHRHQKTGYRLDVSTLALPYVFERKDGMSEMNWPNGPDPFGYRKHRGDISRGA